MKRIYLSIIALLSLLNLSVAKAQIDVEHVISIGRNALHFEDYLVSMGYFGQAIDSRPWLAEPYFYRAVAKLSLEDFGGAEADASLCLERNPFISRAYLLRGIARQNRSLYELAIRDYKKGLELAPNNEPMRINMALSELELKRYDEAKATLDKLLRFSPKETKAYNILAYIALEKKDTIEAIRLSELSLHYDAMQVMPYKLEAQVYFSKGLYARGEQAINKAIDLEPKQADLYSLRALLRYKDNNLRGAMTDYSEAINLAPDYKLARHNRALLLQQVGANNSAVEDWNYIIKQEPRNYIARYNRAVINLDLGQARSALKDLNIILKQYPTFAQGFLLRSQIYNAIGQKQRAEKDYWHAFDLQQSKAYLAKAKQRAKQNKKDRATRKDSDEAIDKYNLLMEDTSNTKQEQVYYSSKIRGRIQNKKLSIEAFSPFYLSFFDSRNLKNGKRHLSYYAKELEPLQSKAYLGLKHIFLQSKTKALTQEQIVELQQAVRTELKGTGDKASYFLVRGLVFALLQDYEQAIADYKTSLEYSPNALAYLSLSNALLRQAILQKKEQQEANLQLDFAKQKGLSRGAYPTNAELNRESLQAVPIKGISHSLEALKALDECVALAPNFAYAYFNRAYLFKEQGDEENALIDYSQAIKLNPTLGEAYFNRGLIYLSQGKKNYGIADLSRAGELGIYEAYSVIKRMQ